MTLQALLKKGPMPTPFDIDVRYLRMEIEGLLDKIVPAVVSYLKGLRNLRYLHIKANIFLVHSETEVICSCCILSFWLLLYYYYYYY